MTRLYRIPQPWDWHRTGAVFVVAETPDEAVAKVRERHERESVKRDEFFRLQRLTPGIAGTKEGIAAWATYRATHPEIEFDGDFARGCFQWDEVEEMPEGFGIAEGCDC